jgi:hypothetical protein
MTKTLLPSLFLLMVLFNACTTSKPNPSSSTIPATETELVSTPSLTPAPSITNSPTPTPYPPTVTPSPTLSPTPKVLTKQCFPIASSLPDSVIPQNILVVNENKNISLINFRLRTQKEIPGSFGAVGTSPDGKWLVYLDAYSNQNLQFVPAMEGKPKTMPAEGLVNYLISWLDNQRIWTFGDGTGVPFIPGFEAPGDGTRDPFIPGTIIQDPFTGQSVTIKTDYPGMRAFDFGRTNETQFEKGNAIYDPSLRLVVYPEYIPDQDYFQTFLTLWDRTTQKKLARVRSSPGYRHLPIWQASLGQFLVVGLPEEGKSEEWFTLNPNGQVKQLTNLGQRYIIDNDASLSPDGKTLAFGSKTVDDNGKRQADNLLLLNLETMHIVNTCIVKDTYSSQIWSVDGQYLAVTVPIPGSDDNQILLVDPKEEETYVVFEGKGVYTGGWLIQP